MIAQADVLKIGWGVKSGSKQGNQSKARAVMLRRGVLTLARWQKKRWEKRLDSGYVV